MSALGFALVVGGALLIYAGMTGGSLVGAVAEVVDGRKAGPTPTDDKRDQALAGRVQP